MLALRIPGLLVLALLLSASTCKVTVPLQQLGSQLPADIEGRFDVLGVLRRETFTGDVPNGESAKEIVVSVNLPVGTVAVVPILDGWMLGQGTLDVVNFQWNSADNHWGLGATSIFVKTLDTAATPPTAEVHLVFYLGDAAPGDQWFGAAQWHVMALGESCPCPPTTTTSTIPPVLGRCCGTQRMVLATGPGLVRYTNLPPFPIPAGASISLDLGPAVGAFAECRHDVIVPEGGFSFPPFDIQALNYCAQIVDPGCEQGSGWGAGTLWDGNGSAGVALTNVTKVADTSDGTCNPGGQPCNLQAGGAGTNTLGNVDTSFTPAPGGGMRTAFDLRLRTVVWMDSFCHPTGSPGCCALAKYGDSGADVLIYRAESVLTLTTNTASAAFVDANGDGCAYAGVGFGNPMPDGPATLAGTPAPGPCCQARQQMTLVGENVEFSGGAPIFDVGIQFIVPAVVRACVQPLGQAPCTVTTDPCQR
jgi:hypothetical protein